MLLGVKPACREGGHVDLDLTPVGAKASVEAGERDHDRVRVGVGARALAWLVAVLEDAHAVVLEDDSIELRVGHDWIVHGTTVP